MTEAFRKDTMRTMRKTMNRFCSILLIVALGVGFFAGVRPPVMTAGIPPAITISITTPWW